VHGAFEILVTLPVAIGFLDNNVALDQQALEDLVNLKAGEFCIAHTQGDVFEITEQSEVLGTDCHTSFNAFGWAADFSQGVYWISPAAVWPIPGPDARSAFTGWQTPSPEDAGMMPSWNL
jgi:hypothetical protein